MTCDGTARITDSGLVQVGAWPSLEKNHLLCPRNSSAIAIAAPDETSGVHVEYEYVAQVCGIEDSDWKRELQKYFSRGGKHYDELFIRLKSGELRRFYFDITDFYGRR